jgi:hypothetical protein
MASRDKGVVRNTGHSTTRFTLPPTLTPFFGQRSWVFGMFGTIMI